MPLMGMPGRRGIAGIALLLAACGGSHPRAADAPAAAPVVAVAPPAPDEARADAGVDAGAGACLSPWDGGGNPEEAPRAIDESAARAATPDNAPPEVAAFRRAQLAYEARHWDVAARAFLHIARTCPDKEIGAQAFEMYVGVLHALTTRAGRRACVEELAATFPALFATYCGTARARFESECRLLDDVDVMLVLGAAQRDFDAAGPSHDTARLVASGDSVLAAAERHCVAPRTAPECADLFYDAVLLYTRAGAHDRAQHALTEFADPANSLASSRELQRATCLVQGKPPGACP